jgi:hypothetical protein
MTPEEYEKYDASHPYKVDSRRDFVCFFCKREVFRNENVTEICHTQGGDWSGKSLYFHSLCFRTIAGGHYMIEDK